MKRIFLAIDIVLSESYRSRIQKLKSDLTDERIRWVKPENYHITLHFFGDTRAEDQAKLVRLLTEFVSKRKALSFSLGHLAFFKKGRDPQVLFVSVEKSLGLQQLASDLETVLVDSGYAQAEKSFRPHLTIARMKKLEDREKLIGVIKKIGEFAGQAVQVEKLVLYESILKPEGPEYNPIQSFALNG